MQSNGLLIHGKNNPNLRYCWCFKVKQSNIKLVLIPDPEVSSVSILYA